MEVQNMKKTIMIFSLLSGMKDSFKGDLHGQGKNAVDFFTEEKVVITRWF